MKVESETFPGAGLQRHVCDNETCRKPIVIAFTEQGRAGEFCSNKCLKEALHKESNTMTEETGTATAVEETKKKAKKGTAKAAKKTAAKGKAKKAPKAKAKNGEARDIKVVGEPREGSKGALVINALKRASGATLAQLEKITGWNTNSIRGFLSTAGVKYSLKITSEKAEGKDRVYSAK